jgi:hypothetical protein
MDQPPLDNRTDFAAHPQLLLDRDGEKLVAIVKATFEVAEDGGIELAPAARRRGVRFADIPWEKDKPESLCYPADVCLHKPATDVIVVAKAHAPHGKPAPRIDVRVEVGPIARSIAVYGTRLWLEKGAGLTDPRPLAELEMRWDHAWGGRDDSDPAHLLEEPRNPIGTGVTRNPTALTHAPAPSIEDPSFPILSARTAPKPVGLGPIGRSWEPRRAYAGTYDQVWQEFRAPLLPEDFDDRFHLAAPSELIVPAPLLGGEPARLLNLIPGGGALAFALPKIALVIELHVKGREPELFRPHLDTVLLDLLLPPPGMAAVVELSFRAHVKAPRRMKDARVIVREEGIA